MRQMILAGGTRQKSRVTDTSPPLVPTNLAWSSPSPDVLVLTWTPGIDPDSAILRHDVMVDGEAPFPADSPSGTTITGLKARTTYTVSIRAVSAGGPSEWLTTVATTILVATLTGFPAALDDIHALMRPQSGVAWTGTVALDGSADYTSVADAAKAAHNDNPSRTPTTRALIFIKPGTYVAPLVELGNWMGLIGTTGNPRDVIIQNVTSAATMADGGRGAVDTWGSTFAEAVTIKRVNTDATAGTLSNPKYTVHGSAGACSIWANCIFDLGQSTNGYGMPSIFGQDGTDGGYTLFYRSGFIGCRSDSDVNIHSSGNPTGASETLLFVACTYDTTHVADDRPGLPTSGGFGYGPMSDQRHDALWVVDCAGIASIGCRSAAGLTVHNPGHVPFTAPSNPGTIDERTDWPQPNDWKVTT